MSGKAGAHLAVGLDGVSTSWAEQASGGAGQLDDDMLEAEQPMQGSKKRGRGSSSASGSQADYAMRHQAAEQRRRARINERLDALRKLVPHDPRSNTAAFLEDVIKFILALKDTNEKLEQALLASHPGAQNMVAAAAAAAAARNAQQQQQQQPAPPPAAAAVGLAAPPRPNNISPAPSVTANTSASQLQASLVQAQVASLQQLLNLQAAAAQANANGSRVGPPALAPTPPGTSQPLLPPPDLDTSGVHAPSPLMGLPPGPVPPGGGAPGDADAVLRNLLSNSNAMQLLGALGGSSAGPPLPEQAAAVHPQPPQPAPGAAGAGAGGAPAPPSAAGQASFQQLLSAVSQLAPGQGQPATSLPPPAVKTE